jgi:hypothetical protein
MAGHRDLWRPEPDGVLAAEAGRYRLIAQAPERTGGSVRFMVLRREDDEAPLALVGSGMEADLRTAMKSAARMADRFVGQPSMQSDQPDAHMFHDTVVTALHV